MSLVDHSALDFTGSMLVVQALVTVDVDLGLEELADAGLWVVMTLGLALVPTDLELLELVAVVVDTGLE